MYVRTRSYIPRPQRGDGTEGQTDRRADGRGRQLSNEVVNSNLVAYRARHAMCELKRSRDQMRRARPGWIELDKQTTRTLTGIYFVIVSQYLVGV